MSLSASAFFVTIALLLAGPARADHDLQGVIQDSEGRPIAGASVQIYTAAVRVGTSPFCPSCYVDCQKRAVTAEDGSFTVPSLDPTLTFQLLLLAEGFQPQFHGGADPEKAPLKLTLRRRELGKLAATQILRGRVVDGSGAPVEGATVEPFGRVMENGALFGLLEGVDPLAITNSAGEFALVAREPGAVLWLKASARGLAPRLFAKLPAGEKAHQLALSPGAFVSGRLTHEGRPLAGVRMGLVQTDRSCERFVGQMEIGTDAEGTSCSPMSRRDKNTSSTESWRASANGAPCR